MAATNTAQGTQDWQQYWDSWFQNQRQFTEQQIKSSTAMQSQWSEMFKEWQNGVGATQPNAGMYKQFFSQAGQQYLNMLEQFYQGSGQNKPVGEVTGEWLRGLQQFFLTMLQSNTQPFDLAETYKTVQDALAKGGQAWQQAFQTGGPFAQSWNPQGWGNMQGMNGFGAQGFGAPGFNGFAQGFNGFNPQAFTQGFNPQAAMQNLDPFGFYASLPGIGYTREKQDAWNHLYKLFSAFTGEVRKYNAGMAQVGLEATHNFQEYVSNPPEGAAPLTSLKEIYAKWVDVCEEVYARYAMSDEYTKMYGDVVNALMAYKAQANKLLEDMADQFNLPTRTEVDSLHERLHALRRDNLELRKAVNELRGIKTKAKPAGATQGGKSSKKGGKK